VEIELNMYNRDFSLKISNVCRNVSVTRVSNFVIGMGTLCNYGYSFSHVST